MTDSEIIRLLGGPAAVARICHIKPPSVHGWQDSGIPEGRLIELAALIESKADGRFTRKARWPDRYAQIWPELAGPTTEAAHA